MDDQVSQKFEDLKELINTKFDRVNDNLNKNNEDHFTIAEQVKKTNGRVTKLEEWRYRILGGLAVLIALAVPIFSYAIKMLFFK